MSLASSFALSFGVQGILAIRLLTYSDFYWWSVLNANIGSAYIFSTFGREAPTEHYYDISGALTHLSLVAQAFYIASKSTASSSSGALLTKIPSRVLVMGVLSAAWATRLGLYLYDRVKVTTSVHSFKCILFSCS